MLFWTGFAAALLLVGVLCLPRWLRELGIWSTPEGVARARAQELIRCGLVLQAHGLEDAAVPVWLHLGARFPQWAILAEYHLSRALLSGCRTDARWVETYQAMARAHPGNMGLVYQLGKTLQNLGRTAEARECWERVAATDDAGWKYRAEEDLAAAHVGLA